MATQKTFLAFPAAHEDPIFVDASDFDEGPTEPFNAPPPPRETGRPSAPELAALVDATRDPPPWLEEPRWAIDPNSGQLVLATPYRARQVDCHGNTFTVECSAGLALEPPTTRAQARAMRTSLVGAALRAGSHAWVTRGAAELLIPLDEQWRREIVTAFRDGDAGVRARG